MMLLANHGYHWFMFGGFFKIKIDDCAWRMMINQFSILEKICRSNHQLVAEPLLLVITPYDKPLLIVITPVKPGENKPPANNFGNV